LQYALEMLGSRQSTTSDFAMSISGKDGDGVGGKDDGLGVGRLVVGGLVVGGLVVG